MKTVSDLFLLLFLGILSFSSCRNNDEKYLGLWEANTENGELVLVYELTSDSLIFYQNNCASYLYKSDVFPVSFESVIDDTLFLLMNLSDNLGNDTSVMMKIINDSIYENRLLLEDDVFYITKSNIPKQSDFSKAEVSLLTFKFNIKNRIKATEKHFQSLKPTTVLSNEAKGIISYIDSLRADFLSHYGINYDSEDCWISHDSLLAYKLSTEILIGSQYQSPKDDHFSAQSLHDKLFSYLKLRQSDSDVISLFPYMNKDGINPRMFGSRPVHEGWIIKHFYHVPMGNVVVKLNELKVKIIQIERSQNNKFQ